MKKGFLALCSVVLGIVVTPLSAVSQRGVVVVGLGYDRDGKGKLIDGIIEPGDVVVRAQGAAIGGQHVWINGTKYELFYLPVGILSEGVKCYLAGGMIIDLELFFKEIADLEKKNVKEIPERLRISTNIHLIMPYHKRIDTLANAAEHVRKGSSLREGVRPASADKRFGISIRVADLFSDDFGALLKKGVDRANDVITKLYQGEPVDYKKTLADFQGYKKKLAPFVRDQVELKLNLMLAQKDGPRVILEGSHSAFLDVTHGSYPNVSAGSTTASGICAEAGVGPTRIGHTLGVVPAYSTLFHDSPFPTEIKDPAVLAKLTPVTNQKRDQKVRYGWVDVVMVRQGIMMNGVDSIAITRLDDLDTLDEIKMGVHYKLDGVDYDYRPPVARDWGRVTVSYNTFKGWKKPIGRARKFSDLPEEARDFVKTLERAAGKPVTYISVGPDRDQIIEVEPGLVPTGGHYASKKVSSACACPHH